MKDENLSEILSSIAVGAFCGLLLNVFFLAVKHEWPTNYFNLMGSVDPMISRNFVRYSIFRFVPPVVGVLAASITTERMGGSVTWAVVAALLMHLHRVLFGILRDLSRARFGRAVAMFIVVVIVIATSVGATTIRSFFTALVPTPGELVANIWAGVLAAIGAVYLHKVSMVRKEPKCIAARFMEEIPWDVVQYALNRSVASAVPPEALVSVMIAENMQRPRWLRRLETWAPGLKSSRTLHIMQQKGATSDRHSIDLALERYFEPRLPVPDDDWERDDWSRLAIADYNSAEPFRGLASAILESIRYGDEDDPLKAAYDQAVGKAQIGTVSG